MKRIITVLLIAVLCGANAWAQKGMHGLGVDIPVSIGRETTALGIGAKYYYNFSNYYRLELSAEYLPIHTKVKKEYDYPLFETFLNSHIFFVSPRPSRPYIIAGLGYVNHRYKVYRLNSEYSEGCFNCDIGLGYDFRLNHSFSMQVEALGMDCLYSRISHNERASQLFSNVNHKGNWTFLGRIGLTFNF